MTKALLCLMPILFCSCIGVVTKPCDDGGEPPRGEGVVFKGTKQCDQKKEKSTGKYMNDGKYREWYPNGQLALEGEYKMGVKTGKWFEYDQKGKKISEKWYDNGVEQTPVRTVK